MRAWNGFNALIEAPSQRVPGAWSSYLARFDVGGLDVTAHPEAVIGRSLDEAMADELLRWRGARQLTDSRGVVAAVSINAARRGGPVSTPAPSGDEGDGGDVA